MYERILAAVNEFTNSETAARYALVLSRSCRARLFLVFVAEEGVSRDHLMRAESALERLFIEAEEQGIEVKSIAETGDPFERIRELVKREKIDLTFVATRREDVKKRFYLKTLARKLVLKLPCSVAMVRVVRMGKAHARHILVPLRGHMSSLDERACFVAKLAQGFGAEVTIFHTPKPITSFFHGELHLPPAQRERHVPKDVEHFTVCLSRHMIRHDKRTGYGRVPQTITIEAAHRRNDLIVMGASERSLFRSFVSGNPVEDVLRETPCNLIVFRPGHGP